MLLNRNVLNDLTLLITTKSMFSVWLEISILDLFYFQINYSANNDFLSYFDIGGVPSLTGNVPHLFTAH